MSNLFHKLGKRILSCFILLSLMLSLCGCSALSKSSVKLEDLDFTVISEELLSPKLLSLIEERKSAPFKMTYKDGNDLFICVGYGEQATGGYSITVNELFLTEDAIHISTSLLGPGPEDTTTSAVSYPYLVVKIEYQDKTVVFD